MAKAIALVGSLVDVRNIAAHKCVRLAIDVPAEQATEIVKTFGWPTMASPVPVAVARLNEVAATPEPLKAQAKRAWGELSPAAQAGIRCAEPDFQQFLEANDFKCSDAEMAATAVRLICGVNSRAELMPGSEATAKWHKLNGDYEFWRRGYDHAV